MFRLLMILLGSLFLQLGCQSNDHAQKIMDNYLYRLANSLEQNKPDLARTSSMAAYPSRRDLLIEIAPVKINLLEFLKLSQCDVQRLVGERNSSLGRVSKDSQRLLYDIKFIKLAEKCVQWLVNNNEQLALKDKLAQAIAHKKQFLSSQWFNATFASDEFSALFSLGSRPLTLEQAAIPADKLEQALNNLTTVYTNQLLSADTIEDDFAIIGSSHYVGQLRHSMSVIHRMIEAANPLLDYRINQKPLCINQRPNPQSDIVHTVFLKFYVGQIQPYIAQVHQQAKTLLGQIDVLQQPHDSRAFTGFWQKVYAGNDSEWQQFNKQVASHTLKWQKLLAQCGLQPGQ